MRMAAAAIVGLWLAFALTHMGLSSLRLRPRLVAALGDRAFLGLYSLLALAIFVPLVATYFGHKHEGPLLWYFGHVAWLRWLMYAGMALALALLAGGLLRPSPAAVAPGKSEVAGVYHVTRHPLFMSFAIYGLLHLLVARVNATELAFFAGFPLFAWLGCRHQDRRKLATAGEAFRRFHDQTGFLPFGGPAGVAALREIPLPLAIGAALAAALRAFHPQLFG
jgi:uncharacterized membrane protein